MEHPFFHHAYATQDHMIVLISNCVEVEKCQQSVRLSETRIRRTARQLIKSEGRETGKTTEQRKLNSDSPIKH